MSISKEVKVALLAIVSISILYLGFNYLKGIDFLSPTTTYYTVYDNIDGLTVSNPVMINGMSVGRVGYIAIDQVRNNRILVTLEVNNDIILSNSTVARLSGDLLGSKFIVLEVGNLNNPLQEGDTIKGQLNKGIAAILEDPDGNLAGGVQSTLLKINTILDNLSGGSEKIGSMLEHFDELSVEFKGLVRENRGNLSGITGNMKSLTDSLLIASQELKPLLVKFNQIADSINQMELKTTMLKAQDAVNNLNSMLASLDQGNGSLGKLLKDDSLYQNLNSSAEDLDKLMIDIKENPKRYINFSVFGRKDKKKEEGK